MNAYKVFLLFFQPRLYSYKESRVILEFDLVECKSAGQSCCRGKLMELFSRYFALLQMLKEALIFEHVYKVIVEM